MYYKIKLSTQELIDEPTELPYEIAGWTTEDVKDLSTLNPAYGFEDIGFWIIVDQLLDYNPQTHDLSLVMTMVDTGEQVVKRTYSAVQNDRRCADLINQERERRILEGKDFNGIYLKGDQANRDNLDSLAFGASLRLGLGDTQTVTKFRDSLNKDHNLTPLQVVSLWQVAATYVSSLYQKSWDIKGLEEFPQDYTEDKYWL